jgi:FMN phosphatase YigB (HAD superfamily)
MAKLLKDSGFELYLATDSSRNNAIQTLKTAGYPPEMFKKIITGDDVKFAKPNTEMYEKIVVQIGYQDEEMTRTEYNPYDWIVIGDRITDIIPAAKLGLRAFLTNKEGLRWFLWTKEKEIKLSADSKRNP